MDEGREYLTPEVSTAILGHGVAMPSRVYSVRDRQHPETLFVTIDLADAITFAGSVVEH